MRNITAPVVVLWIIMYKKAVAHENKGITLFHTMK